MVPLLTADTGPVTQEKPETYIVASLEAALEHILAACQEAQMTREAAHVLWLPQDYAQERAAAFFNPYKPTLTSTRLCADMYPYQRRDVLRQWAAGQLDVLILAPDLAIRKTIQSALSHSPRPLVVWNVFENYRKEHLSWGLSRRGAWATSMSQDWHGFSVSRQIAVSATLSPSCHLEARWAASDAHKWQIYQSTLSTLPTDDNPVWCVPSWPSRHSPLRDRLKAAMAKAPESGVVLSELTAEDTARLAGVTDLVLLMLPSSASELAVTLALFPAVSRVTLLWQLHELWRPDCLPRIQLLTGLSTPR